MESLTRQCKYCHSIIHYESILHYFEFVQAGVIIQNSESIFEYANEKICRMLGYTKEEILDNTNNIITDTIKALGISSSLNSLMTTTIDYENHPLIRKDKSIFMTQISITAINNKLLIFIRDIDQFHQSIQELFTSNESKSVQISQLNTELFETKKELEELKISLELQLKNQTEKLIKANDEVEAAQKIKSALMRNLSHEIRTPLNGILGCADLLMDEELNSEDRNDLYLGLKISANRLLQTASNIKELSLINSGEIELKIIQFNPNNLIYELYEVYLNTTERDRSIDLRTQIQNGHESIIIKNDEQKIFQIMSIFTDNAIKFTQKGYIELSFQINEHQIEFSVTDTGIGIPEAELNKIFESFYQQDLSHTRRYEGNGLGLAIAKGYADIIKGKICVNSQVGIGSTFTLILPRGTIISS